MSVQISTHRFHPFRPVGFPIRQDLIDFVHFLLHGRARDDMTDARHVQKGLDEIVRLHAPDIYLERQKRRSKKTHIHSTLN